jgi:hypothetical protein
MKDSISSDGDIRFHQKNPNTAYTLWTTRKTRKVQMMNTCHHETRLDGTILHENSTGQDQESASSDDEPLMLLKSRTPHILKATPKATKTSPSIHVVLAYLQKTKVAKEESNRSTVLRMG